MAKFRKKPVVIEAWQWQGQPESEWPAWVIDYRSLDGDHIIGDPKGLLNIPTLEGFMTASANDWIIQGVQGEVYPCKPAIFAATYEPVD